MKHADLPERWKKRLIQWIRQFSDHHRTELSAADFPMSYQIAMRFVDDSQAQFDHAIAIEEPLLDEIGIFTEHCGYHVFPLAGTHIARIEK